MAVVDHASEARKALRRVSFAESDTDIARHQWDAIAHALLAIVDVLKPDTDVREVERR